MSVGTMAKKKQGPKQRQKPGPKPDPAAGRREMTNIRSSAEWKQWVEGFADWDRATTLAELIDRALVSYARERGYDKPAPKR